jgi:tRNA1(Val) A37 N6-methylase TrmN6
MTAGAEAALFTEDRLLGGRLRLLQPREGYRIAIDPVFLAAAVPAAPQQMVLDVGCGTGAAMLCLAHRATQCRVVGLEMRRELVRLAGDNVILNGMTNRVSVMMGDLLRPPPRLAPGTFDHVMANPPYHEAGRVTPPASAQRAAAEIEGEANLAAWVRFALSMVRTEGTLTFVHRADRFDALIAQIAGRAGGIVLFPLWPMPGKPASRILVQARKGIAAPARIAPGLVLHEEDGRLTALAEGILRDGNALSLVS